MTKTCLLDYDSIAGADKFGNIFVLRVPADVSDDVDNPTGVNSPVIVSLLLVLHRSIFILPICHGALDLLASSHPSCVDPSLHLLGSSPEIPRKPTSVGLRAPEWSAEQGRTAAAGMYF